MLEIKSLAASYGAGEVLEQVNIEVPRGSVVTILGPNGAGKTTVMRAACGLLPLHGGRVLSGSVTLDGAAVVQGSGHTLVRRGIAQVLEGRHILGEFTVEENLRAGAYTTRSRQAVSTRLREMYELFPILEERKAQVAGYLSGGQQQMLAIGRALMSRPRLLMLDEPSLGLAPKIVSEVGTIISTIRDAGASVLLVEQNAAMALAVSDFAYVLEGGTVLSARPSEELRSDESLLRAYLGVQQ